MTVAPVVVADRYRLGEALGQGGMGRVWLARDQILDRDVAIKEIVPPAGIDDADRPALQERTLREARAAARINHPNAAQVYDVIAADGVTWIVMEYVRSRSLQEVLREDGPLPPRRVAEIGLAVLAALEVAHAAGVRHRDVKPANVLMGDDGRVVLTDFGIATIEGDGIVTSSDLVLGSPQYMSPERVRDGTALEASDLWSLGATLYTAVEGHSPYDRASVVETLTAVAADEPEPPHSAGVLAPVLAALLRKNPAQRADLAEARRLLEQAASGEPAVPARRSWLPRRNRDSAAAPVPPPPAAPAPVVPRQRMPEPGPGPADPPRRRRTLLAAGAAVVVLAGAGTTWYALRDDDSRGPGAVTAGRPTASASTAPGSPAAAGTAPASPAAVPPASAPGTSPSASPSTSPATGKAGEAVSRPALPAGWRDYRDKTGFRVYVPNGWTRSQKGTIVYFRDGKGEVLGIDQTNKPRKNPVADWQGKERARVRAGDFPGYRRVRIDSVPYFQKAADWEYTFNGSSRRHVNNRGVVTSKKQAYGIYFETSDARWKSYRDDLQLVFDSFRPAT